MGVDLLTFSNHNLKSKTFLGKIEEIGSLLDKSILDIPYVEMKGAEQASDFQDAIYFNDFQRSEEYFKACGHIELFSNFKLCFSIRIFEKTLKISPKGFSTDWYNWKHYVSRYFQNHNIEHQHFSWENEKNKWEQFHQHVSHVISQLKGNHIVIFDDQSYQEAEDFFYTGKSLEEIIPELEKIGRPYQIKQLIENFESIDDGYYWFYDKIE